MNIYICPVCQKAWPCNKQQPCSCGVKVILTTDMPILMAAPMVNATLADRKTQTRRLVKNMALDWLDQGFTPEFVALPANNLCPYGNPGGRLWVRENFSMYADRCLYKADYANDKGHLKWKPSIHMFRKDSRIDLSIVSVKIERLNDISDEDCEKEGIDFLRHIPDADETLTPKQLFMILWESINGPGSWELNPWLWVVEFERVKT